MYFPGEELNDIDPILNAIEDLEARASLISSQLPAGPENELRYEFNIVLRGNRETPFFVDP
jgi:protocatechuate 3,4-dioxygenase beta subunit